MENKSKLGQVMTVAAVILVLTLSVYLFLQNRVLTSKVNMLLEERNFFLLENASSTKAAQFEREVASSTIYELSSRLALTNEELEDLESDFRREKNKNDEFEDQIKAISGTVGVLDKLSKTDKELLQKYSRTYFLNENFVPLKLTKINNKYVLVGKKEQYFHGDAAEFLTDMIDEANNDGIDLKIVSAYRSFDEQKEIKGSYTVIYGSGSNAFSADQGYSEHQLGTTVDLSDPVTNGAYLSFANTKEYAWLIDNAYRFGFILSYPERNTFYVFEPWHWRFVGTDLARDLHKQKAEFYEWDQRKIDGYLVSIFD